MFWARTGKIAVQAVGDGRSKRLIWGQREVDEAKRIKDSDRRGASDENKAMIDALGGPPFIQAFMRAQRVMSEAGHGEVVVAGINGARVFQDSTSLRAVANAVTSGFAVIFVP
jgi:hypothetical protein